MKDFLRCFFCLLFISFQSDATPVETMKNLELKIQLNQEKFDNLTTLLNPYYSETLAQTDTYFASKQGRLKLREQNGKKAYLIRYQRPDLEEAKQSSYLFYPIDDVSLFLSVLGDSLKEEIKVKKQRALYLPKPHIRIHLDQVESLGDFLEIEIVLSKEMPRSLAETEMCELQDWLQLTHLRKITHGYRELLQQKMTTSFTDTQDLNYYKNPKY